MQKFATLALAVLVTAGVAYGWINFQAGVMEATSGTTAPVVAAPAATPSAGESSPDVVLIGDSYAAGDGSSADYGWAEMVAENEGWDLASYAMGGTGYVVAGPGRPTFGEQVREAASDEPGADLVLVQGGRNDLGVAGVDGAVSRFYADARAAFPNAEIVAVNPLWDTGDPPPELRQIGAWIQAAVTDAGGTYLNIGQPLGQQTDDLDPDNVHPNDKGHGAIAREFRKAFALAEPLT